jgi:hypothetical protein
MAGSPFWTSSPYVSDAGAAWTVEFINGTSRFARRTTKNHVRCVR